MNRRSRAGSAAQRRSPLLRTLAAVVFLSSLAVPVQAEGIDPRVAHLERRAAQLRLNVRALEEALSVQPPSFAAPVIDETGRRSERTPSSSDRIIRLERRVARLDGRITTLERAVFDDPQSGPAYTLRRSAANQAVRPRLRRLEQWMLKLERKVAAIEEVLPNTQPSPTGPPDWPCRGVELTPEVDLRAHVSGEPQGTTFCLSPGVYRLAQPLKLMSGQRLIGAGGGDTIISGAKIVEATRERRYWVVTGQTSLGTSGESLGCRPVEGVDPQGMCVHNDQVFLNDRNLWQVGSLGELSTGEFYWDYSANKIYLVDDPAGKKLEVSAVSEGIGGASGVVLENLVVEKFGNHAQSGAVSANSHWTLRNLEVRLNHGGGIHMSEYTVVRDSYIHHNGQLGIHGGQSSCAGAEGLVLENSEISYNNTAGYNYGMEGGASKWNYTEGLVARGNHVHHNYGAGLWTDGGNIDTLFEDNLVEHNYGSGIVIELSYHSVIRGNVTRGNGFDHPIQGDVYGAGIRIDQSRDVEVYDNLVENNAAGITATHEPTGSLCYPPPLDLTNLFAHDNVIRQPSGLAAGMNLRDAPSSFYETSNNRWEENEYNLGDLDAGLHFFWYGDTITWESWRSYGQDADSSFLES